MNSFINFIYAEDSEYDNLSIQSKEQIEAAKTATEKYCSESIKSTGCIFDANNTLYTQSQKHVSVGRYYVGNNSSVQFVFPDSPYSETAPLCCSAPSEADPEKRMDFHLLISAVH